MVKQELENIQRAFDIKNRYVRTLEKRNKLLERLLADSWTTEQLRQAQERYEKNPKKTVRSDDSYTMWEDRQYWHELTIYEKIAYIYSEDEIE